MPKIAHQRLHNQLLGQHPLATPGEIVAWLGAVQAQDYLASLWALGLRLPNATESVIEQAIAEHSIVRTWPMRGTIHFVPPADAKWMLRHLTPRVITRAQSIYRTAGLDEAQFAQSRDLVERALQAGKPLTRNALYEVLEAGGIVTTNYRGLHILGYLAQMGLICFGPREGKQPTFVLLEAWVPDLRMLERDDALAELARRYFTSHGPATAHDFAWWTGLSLGDARAGVEAVKSQLVEETITGQTYWWAEATPGAPVNSPGVYLLPAFDEYLVSYKDRSASVDLQNSVVGSSQVHLGPVIVSDGQVIGTWKRTFKQGAVVIEATYAQTLTSAERAGFEAAAWRYGEFLGMPVVLAG
jgi:hypothetical protein